MNHLHCDYNSMTVLNFVNLYKNGQLNLTPGFQRDSVWKPSDRQKLIQSILNGFPIPSVFLYKNTAEGKIIYDVIDGKQRLESILMFMGVGRFRAKTFSAKWVREAEEVEKRWTWATLEKSGLSHQILGYKIQVAEVSVDGSNDPLQDVINLFVLINSTGKSLTGMEKKQAKFFKSKLLITANELANRHQTYFRSQKIISAAQQSRRKHVELVAELLASIKH
jgi:hypothetical protein